MVENLTLMADNGGPAAAPNMKPVVGVRSFPWLLILCLVGLDYFSTLAYLPSIAVTAAGPLAPLAALGVVAVSFFAAVPVYFYVVGRSPDGHGATGLLARLVRGWFGKVMILVLLGFIATDFVITRSLSVADASEHILHNPLWVQHSDWATQNREQLRGWFPGFLQGGFFDFWNEQLVLTVVLTLLAFAFYAYLQRGFTKNFFRLAVFTVGLYLTLTAVVIAAGLWRLASQPELFTNWMTAVEEAGLRENDGLASSILAALVLLALLPFPQMALGLSGFELSMATAPLVKGHETDNPEQPRGRIRNTRKMLIAAAAIMSVFLVGSVLVVTLLVPRQALENGGPAAHRALAYLAHGEPLGDLMAGGSDQSLGALFGPWFGGLYDFSSVLILCLAGASVTIGMRDLVPHYLARFGMQLEWAGKVGVILHLFNAVILLMVVVFQASVAAQQWAYATSVLVLLTSASIAAVLDLRERWRGSWLRLPVMSPYVLIGAFFLGMAGLTVWINRSGLGIAVGFLLTVFVTAALSRYWRSMELRFEGFTFADEASKKRWEEIYHMEFQVLVPHRPGGKLSLQDKNRLVRRKHRIAADVPLIFIEVELGDPSDFMNRPLMRIEKENGAEVIRVSRCSSTAHVLAAIALEFAKVGCPPELIFGWSNESPLAANVSFLLLGEGNIPWLVRELIRRAERDPARQPQVAIG